jgi:hypothetical protein
MAKKAYTPRTPTSTPPGIFVRQTPQGVRIFTSAAEAEWYTIHDDARKEEAFTEGSLAAMVCMGERPGKR